MPALVLVRVGLGVSIENVEAPMPSFQARMSDTSPSVRLTTLNVGTLSGNASHGEMTEESWTETVV